LTTDQLEKIGAVDVLLVPVGGTYTIEAKDAVKVISQIEPKIVIPMHYLLPKHKEKLDDVDKFLKAMGSKSIEPQNKLTIKQKDLPEEDTQQIVILNP
jgi:L-ascorbate metabolism protein UlaG (beta-lactamase superfamily)